MGTKRRLRKLRKLTKKLGAGADELLNLQEATGRVLAPYDPDEGPVARDWLSIQDDLKLALVKRYHEQAGLAIEGPEADRRNRIHAAMHVVAENQIARGLECAAGQTVYRLEAEGLLRHEAIHAIGMVFLEHSVRAKEAIEAGESISPDSYVHNPDEKSHSYEIKKPAFRE